jgi:Tol biopolymer transport system component
VPFDLKRLQIKGTPVPVMQGVLNGTQYSVSATGTLAYIPGSVAGGEDKLVWVSRNGAEQSLASPVRAYDQPRLSPDARRIAVDVLENGVPQVWIYDLARDTLSRSTFGGGSNALPLWTPDGKRIAFSSTTEGTYKIFWQMADGSGGLERLTNGNVNVPFSWSPDGNLLTFAEFPRGKAQEIWVLNVGDRQTRPFLETGVYLDAAQFSPNGHWLAYLSAESGRAEIYVQPYPGPGGKWQISTDGGTEPQWNRNGRELFYRNGDKMMAVDISTQPSFAAGKPRQLFEGRYAMSTENAGRANYDISPDGQRFLMIKPVEQQQAGPTQINVVLNWTEELKRLVPTGK